jgi:hypothetical protein
VATASNNIISLRKNDEKLFDSLHRAERCSKVPVYKLSKVSLPCAARARAPAG